MESVSLDIAGFQMGSCVAFISLVLGHAIMRHWCGAMSCEVPGINNKVIWDWCTWDFRIGSWDFFASPRASVKGTEHAVRSPWRPL